MQTSFLFVAFLCYFTLLCSVSALEAPIALGESDFDRALAENTNILVLFTRLTPNCPECEVAETAFADLQSETHKDLAAITVDCDEIAKLCHEYELNHLPSVVLFNDDLAIYEYKQPYVYLEALEEFIDTYLQPKTTIIQTQEELENEKKDKKILIVGFFNPTEDQSVRASFRRTAGQLFQEYSFVEVIVEDEKDAVMLENDALFDTIKMFKTIGEEVYEETYSQSTVSRKRITNWIHWNTPWPVREIDNNSGSLFVQNSDTHNLPILTVYLDYNDETLKEEIILSLESVADSFRNQILFTYMNGNSESFFPIFKRWGYKNAELPIMMLVKHDSRDVFTFPGHDINQKEIGSFVDDFLQGNLSPHIIKQEIPEEEESGNVQVVVHDSWRSTVFSPTSDVVVFFYLPEEDCPHCITFLNKYENVADSLQGMPGLVMAKIDLSANAQVPGLHVGNFPTIQLYPKSNKFQEVVYSGPRTEEAVKNWVLDNLSEKRDNFSDEERRLLGDVI